MSDLGVKHLFLAALALILGVVVGGLGPRSEVRDLSNQLAEQPADCSPTAGSVPRELSEMLRGRPWEDAPPRSAPEPRSEPAPDPIVVVPEEEEADESLLIMQETLDLRRSQAFAALEQEAAASDEQLDTIEDAIDTMNDDLAALAEGFVVDLQEQGEPDRHEIMVFARDTLDVLLSADDALYNTLDSDQRTNVEPAALNPFSYVDSRVFERLGEIEDL